MNKPVFTFISDLTAAQVNNYFILNWAYPTDLSNPTGTHDPSSIFDYKLYRHIEIKYPSYQANGGPLIDPANYIPPLNGTSPEPRFKLISTLSPTTTSYTDNLDDLDLHADEGIVYNSGTGRWVDGNGADVVDEIFHTARRIYYKIIAESNKVGFNRLPFIFLCHTDGVECRSLITQVKWNTLYYEGDTIWFNNAVLNCSRTAVDPVIDINVGRFYNVWVSGVGNTVYCLDSRDGEIIRQFTLPINNILGLRVDPDNGDGIVVGSGNTVWRLDVQSGSYTIINNTGAAYAPNGNNGLVLVQEGNGHYVYVVANMDVVAKCGIDSAINSVVPRTTFGCSSSTNPNIPNILGITNSTDGAVWVNGHVPIHYKYYYTYTTYSTTCDWISVCPGGSPTAEIIATYHARGNSGTPSCNQAEHYVCQTSSSTTTVDLDLHFLQDIGYVYGARAGINKGIANGQSYPYNVGAIYPYKPFTSKSRSGWFGVSPQGPDSGSYGRPYISGATASPETAPNPAISQKGLASDLPTDKSLTGNVYNIFQTNESENRIHKLTWNGALSTLNYNYLSATESVGTVNVDYWNINNPVHICVDEQNNVWVIQENNPTELTLLYQILSNDSFPNGGLSRWPSFASLSSFGSTSAYNYGNYFSDPYIEYYLTRDTNFVGLTTTPTDGYRNGFGVCLTGNSVNQRESAVAWCLAGTNYLTSGVRLYPHYNGQYSTTSFTRYGGDTIEYNSDNIGLLYMIGQHLYQSEDIQHPSPAYPLVRLNITAQNSSPQSCDEDFWNDQDVNDTAHLSASGYDDFQVELSATLLTMGSFYFQGYEFHLDDKNRDIGGSTNPATIASNNNVINYVYHDPSLNGKPNNRWTGYPAENSGNYEPYVIVNTNDNCYNLSGSPEIITTSNIVESVVWERWPTARFYVTPFDLPVNRLVYLSTWNLSSYSYPVGNNGHPLNSETRIVSGYDPLSAQFTDTSISRTWPISTWFWTFGDKPDYLGFPLDNSIIGVGYAHVTSQIVTASNPPSLRDDCITEHPDMVRHVYKGPGNYYATLWVQASNTWTDSWQISAGITDQNFMTSSFVIAASRRIDVLEICPNIEFEYVSAYTVSSVYSDNDIGYINTVLANVVYNPPFSYFGLISGYSPYLWISLVGHATARSLPFSALRWDFGDPFADPEPYDATTYPYPTAGWPLWNNAPYTITGEHVFVMPGFYDITLVPVVSAHNKDYVSNCTGLRKHMHVYIEELYPVPCFTNSYQQTIAYTTSTLSGTSPTTIYVNPSCTVAKSFGICRVDWDFGDNTPITTISRIMSAEYSNYYNSSAYNDLSDPRNIIISHEYSKTQFSQASSYTISMSAYACNTNSVAVATKTFGPIEMATMDNIEGELELIENRMYGVDNDLLLVFEGQKSLNNFTVLISSERL